MKNSMYPVTHTCSPYLFPQKEQRFNNMYVFSNHLLTVKSINHVTCEKYREPTRHVGKLWEETHAMPTRYTENRWKATHRKPTRHAGKQRKETHPKPTRHADATMFTTTSTPSSHTIRSNTKCFHRPRQSAPYT